MSHWYQTVTVDGRRSECFARLRFCLKRMQCARKRGDLGGVARWAAEMRYARRVLNDPYAVITVPEPFWMTHRSMRSAPI